MKNDAMPSIVRHKKNIIDLAYDLPQLWHAKTTSAKDKKRILRLLIKDITIAVDLTRKSVLLNIRWQGGALENVEIDLPKKCHEKWRHPQELIDQVRELANTLTDQQIAEQFNQKNMKTNKGNAFTAASIQWVRYKHKIPSPNYQQSHELSVKEVSAKFGVSTHVVYYWIQRGVLASRRDIRSRLWITVDQNKEVELLQWIENSPRINTSKCQQHTITNAH